MPQPIEDGRVKYEDGTPGTLANYSKDIGSFLMWASEPTLVERKKIGFRAIIFLIVLSSLLYLTKKKIWADAH
jgi:ubiquinol-cytochrome c reductase cytochrome b/c1 subunit